MFWRFYRRVHSAPDATTVLIAAILILAAVLLIIAWPTVSVRVSFITRRAIALKSLARISSHARPWKLSSPRCITKNGADGHSRKTEATRDWLGLT
jgi:hypothetical protein